MFSDGRLLIGKGEKEVYLEPKMANRHGLIAGATGTGKTITLKVMAESFSDMGVPVFLADIKGDLGGCVKKGVENENITKRLAMYRNWLRWSMKRLISQTSTGLLCWFWQTVCWDR